MVKDSKIIVKLKDVESRFLKKIRKIYPANNIMSKFSQLLFEEIEKDLKLEKFKKSRKGAIKNAKKRNKKIV